MNFTYYTDGSTKGNGTKHSHGAWGYIRVNGQNEELYRNGAAAAPTTNNIMELTAIAEACEDWFRILNRDDSDGVEIYTDSAYACNCYDQKWYISWEANGWKTASRKPVKNQDLWKRLIPFFKNPKVKLIKVAGHADVELNNEIDRFVQNLADESWEGKVN